jgi:hypothetical protein
MAKDRGIQTEPTVRKQSSSVLPCPGGGLQRRNHSTPFDVDSRGWGTRFRLPTSNSKLIYRDQNTTSGHTPITSQITTFG